MRWQEELVLGIEPQGVVPSVFGEGTHPTTRLAQAAIEECLAKRPGARVLDVGTGTGVLVRTALAAGSTLAVGVDHDPAAIVTATERTANGAAKFVRADAADWLAREAGGAFDLVVVNLPDPPLRMLMDALAAAARPHGTLIVTGVLLWQAERVANALADAGARVTALRNEAGWALFIADV